MAAQPLRSEPWPADLPVNRPPCPWQAALADAAAGRPKASPRSASRLAADAADGWLARQVARAAGSFEHGLLGRAPTSVTVVGTGAWMVVYLHEQFSPLERHLAAAGESGARRVSEFHRSLFDRTAEALCEHVRVETGVSLLAAIAHVDTATGSVLKTLATAAEVDLFLLGTGVPALGVPINDHRRAHGPLTDVTPIPAPRHATSQEPGPSRAAGIGAVCR